MGKRKKFALKKGAIPSIFNVPFNISGNACDTTVSERNTPDSFRKELFGEPPSKHLCTTVSSKVCLLLFMFS